MNKLIGILFLLGLLFASSSEASPEYFWPFSMLAMIFLLSSLVLGILTGTLR